MNQKAVLDILPDHVDGTRDFKIFGHFLEHFHRQIYGGVYDPGSHLADKNGFRRDVIEALRQDQDTGHPLARRLLRLGLSLEEGRRPTRALFRQSLVRRGTQYFRHR